MKECPHHRQSIESSKYRELFGNDKKRLSSRGRISGGTVSGAGIKLGPPKGYKFVCLCELKGKYGHLGGILHAGLHAVLTCLVLLLFGVYDAHILLLAILFDFVCHYHIDFTKSKVMKKFDLHTQNYWYWFVHGLDQLLHLLTYYVIIQFII